MNQRILSINKKDLATKPWGKFEFSKARPKKEIQNFFSSRAFFWLRGICCFFFSPFFPLVCLKIFFERNGGAHGVFEWSPNSLGDVDGLAS